MTTDYSTTDEMVLGDLETSLDRVKFITMATTEMNAVIGRVYVVPLTGLADYATLFLKQCSILISSGRFIMASAIGAESESTHAYGQSLLDEGKMMLQQILNGDVLLSGADPAPGTGTTGNAPSIQQGDIYSGVDSFYQWMGSDYDATLAGPYWRPGL